MWKYMLAWIPMVFIAVANGALREGWYGKYLSELQAHQVSTVTGVLLCGGYIWVLLRLWKPTSGRQALTIGLIVGLGTSLGDLLLHIEVKKVRRKRWNKMEV
jgi:hypothetical protein